MRITLSISRWVAICLAAWCCINPGAALAEPRIPQDVAEVLERLPLRPGDTTARELAGLRAEVATAARQTPPNPLPAARLAQRYFDLAMAKGDPRYVGYADAVVQPFTHVRLAPLLTVRGQLLQYRHLFDEALQAFDTALQIDPQYAQAHAWRGAIFLVQTQYTKAAGECDGLQSLGRTALADACNGLLFAYSGQLGKADATLQRALSASQDTDNRLWLLTRLGEVATWRGQVAHAEKYFRAALALDVEDGYLLAAWADFLLDQKRPAEVVQWLAKWDSSDGLLLRLALAETQLKLPAAQAHLQALSDRFAAAKLRGDTTHRAEEARFYLQLRGDAKQALVLAAANYEVQREPRDARVLLEAALAAQNGAPAQPARDWLASSGFEDQHLRQLGAKTAATP